MGTLYDDDEGLFFLLSMFSPAVLVYAVYDRFTQLFRMYRLDSIFALPKAKV